MKIDLPENYYVRVNSSEVDIFDKNMPNNNINFPHKQVARIINSGNFAPSVVYWTPDMGHGDRLAMPSLEAAVAHVQTMAGLGMLGHGYKKGMLE